MTIFVALRADIDGAAPRSRKRGKSLRDGDVPVTVDRVRAAGTAIRERVSDERALVNHIERSGLGRLKVADVRRADVQSMADELLASGLAPGTVSNVLNPIQAFIGA